jgi:hypothetical protein
MRDEAARTAANALTRQRKAQLTTDIAISRLIEELWEKRMFSAVLYAVSIKGVRSCATLKRRLGICNLIRCILANFKRMTERQFLGAGLVARELARCMVK